MATAEHPQLDVVELQPVPDNELTERYNFELGRLQPGRYEIIDLSTSVYDPKQIEESIGFKAPVPAVIQAGGLRLLVVDMRGYPEDDAGKRKIQSSHRDFTINSDFLLINPEEWDPAASAKRGYKAVRSGEPVEFGRKNKIIPERFDTTSDKLSREHFVLEYDAPGTMLIKDLGSKNGTSLLRAKHHIRARGTVAASDRVADRGERQTGDATAPYGYYQGDPILGRGSPRISGGVYLGGGPREAITVDPLKDPRIEQVFEAVIKKQFSRKLLNSALRRTKDPTKQLLEDVYEVVSETLQYDGNAVEAFSKRYHGDIKVSLGDYIQKGIGVCRHQGLLGAYLIERLIDQGKLQGKVRIERNSIPDFGGTHAWATYEAPDGTEYVIDAAQKFVGTKAAARQRARAWDYYLPVTDVIT